MEASAYVAIRTNPVAVERFPRPGQVSFFVIPPVIVLKIPYTALHFKPPFARMVAGSECKFTWVELVWATITVGRAKLKHVVRHGKYSRYELVYRAAIVYANLRQGAFGGLYRSAAYDSLDPSEKSAVSYFLGLTSAKLFAEKYLDIPWLMHLDVYKNKLTIRTSSKSKSRPDLIGHHSSGDWYVIEAKGRTNALDKKVIPAAKKQTKKLLAINGKPPTLRVALASYFDDEQLHVHWEDPEGEERDLPELVVERRTFLDDYYETIVDLLSRDNREIHLGATELPFLIDAIPEADLSVGLSAPAYAALVEEKGAADIVDAISSLPVELPPRTAVASDGVVVQLGESWSEEAMHQEPQDRRANGEV